jgi:hypothetical protein
MHIMLASFAGRRRVRTADSAGSAARSLDLETVGTAKRSAVGVVSLHHGSGAAGLPGAGRYGRDSGGVGQPLVYPARRRQEHPFFDDEGRMAARSALDDSGDVVRPVLKKSCPALWCRCRSDGA